MRFDYHTTGKEKAVVREFIVSVMAADRPGIVAAVSGAVAGLGGNITHLSETVLRGYFTIIFSLEAPETLEPDELRTAVAHSGEKGEFEVGVLPFCESRQAPDKRTERFVLTAKCTDRRGIISRISRTLSDAGINIDDFYAYVHESDLIMILELAVDSPEALAQAQEELDELARAAAVSVHLQHEDIFRATTELQAVLRLGDRK